MNHRPIPSVYPYPSAYGLQAPRDFHTETRVDRAGRSNSFRRLGGGRVLSIELLVSRIDLSIFSAASRLKVGLQSAAAIRQGLGSRR